MRKRKKSKNSKDNSKFININENNDENNENENSEFGCINYGGIVAPDLWPGNIERKYYDEKKDMKVKEKEGRYDDYMEFVGEQNAKQNIPDEIKSEDEDEENSENNNESENKDNNENNNYFMDLNNNEIIMI